MNEIVKTQTGEIISISTANRILAGKTIITEKTTAESLAFWGDKIGVPMVWLTESDAPEGDYQRTGYAEQGEDGNWRTAYELRAYDADLLIQQIEAARKEAEDAGVIVNGIRYSGKQDNRQALAEALNAAAEFGITEFPSWKDNDGGYHANVSVSDVHSALSQIGLRRMSLIGLEGDYVAQVVAGTITTPTQIAALSWAV